MSRITAIVHFGNDRDVLEACLESLQWADEILSIDGNSTDGSAEIAAKYSSKVLKHEYINSAMQKNWAIPLAENEWVLIIDSDERVTPELANECRSRIQLCKDTYHCYRIPRRNIVFGRAMRNTAYWPDYQERLFRRDSCRYSDRLVHARLNIPGSTGTIYQPIIHLNHRSVDHAVQGLLCRMTTWEARQRHREKRKASLLSALVKGPSVFVLYYCCRHGWRDGAAGLFVSLLWGLYIAITEIKLWGLAKQESVARDNQESDV